MLNKKLSFFFSFLLGVLFVLNGSIYAEVPNVFDRKEMPEEDGKAISEKLKEIKKKIEEEGIDAVKFDTTNDLSNFKGEYMKMDVIGKMKDKPKTYVKVPSKFYGSGDEYFANIFILTASPIGLHQQWKIKFEKKDGKWNAVSKDLIKMEDDLYNPEKCEIKLYKISNFNFKHDTIAFSGNATCALFQASGQTVGMVLSAEKSRNEKLQMDFVPPTKEDRYQVRRRLKDEKIDADEIHDEIFTFFATFHPKDYETYIKGAKLEEITKENNPKFDDLSEDLKTIFKEKIEANYWNISFPFPIGEEKGQYLAFLNKDSVTLEFESKKLKWLGYLFDPNGLAFGDDYLPEEVLLYKFGKYMLSNIEMWDIIAMFNRADQRVNYTYEQKEKEDKSQLDLIRNTLDIQITPKLVFKAKANLTFVAKRDLDEFYIALIPCQYGSDGIYDNDGNIYYPRRLQSKILITPNKPLKKGQKYTYNFHYASSNLIEQKIADMYSVVNTFPWKPDHGFLETYEFDLTVKVPSPNIAVACGNKMKEWKEEIDGDNYNCFRYLEEKHPIAIPGFAFGKYTEYTYEPEKVKHVKFYSYVTQGAYGMMLDYNMREWDVSVQYQDDELEHLYAKYQGLYFYLEFFKSPVKYLRMSENIIQFYEKAFKEPFPFDKLAVTQFDYNAYYGQGMAGFLIMMGFSMLSESQKAALFGGADQTWMNGFLAHEISHQWWGHVIPWASTHDQWLSEATAQYSCASYLKWAEGMDYYNKEKSDWRENGMKHDKTGPVWLGGYRLGNSYFYLTYMKGPWVLHMLGATIGHDNLLKVIQNLMKVYRWKKVCTSDFIDILNKTLGQKTIQALFKEDDMTWYINQWIRKVGYPKFTYDWKVIKKEGKRFLKVRIKQENTNPIEKSLFKMRMPIWVKAKSLKKYNYGEHTDKGWAPLWLLVDAKADQEFDIPLETVPPGGNKYMSIDGKIRDAVLDKYEDMYCEVDRDKDLL